METSSSDRELIKQIKRYQHHIQQIEPPENDPQRILHYIRKLSKLPIQLEELEKTGVGKTINALRKRNGSIGEEATLLVARWKSIVSKQVQEEEEEDDETPSKGGGSCNDDDSHSDYGSSGNDVRSSKTTEHKKLKEIQDTSDSTDIKYITLKKHKHNGGIAEEHSSDRKRRHSSDSKHKKEKYRKLSNESVTEESSPAFDVKEELSSSNSVTSREESNLVDPSKKRKKDKYDDSKGSSAAKKEHEKKHHKSSSKHAGGHKDEKHHHRHHSKSSHHDKKPESSSKGDSSHKHRSEKKSSSETKGKRESERKSSSSKKVNVTLTHSSDEESTASGRVKREKFDDTDGYENYAVKTENDTPPPADDDFGAALLGIPSSFASPKKRSTPSKHSNVQSSPSKHSNLHSSPGKHSNVHSSPGKHSNVYSSPENSSSQRSSRELDLLSDNVKLEPLDLDDYFKSTSDGFYSAKHESVREKPLRKTKYLDDEDALNSMTTTKNQRTKVFSGFKSKFGSVKFPTLFELCVRILQENFDALEYTGGVPFDVLKPILEKVTVEQLYTFENYNPYLIGETDELWEFHAKKHFRNSARQEYETWRDLYLRCVEEREEKLQSLTENINQSIANSTPVRKTKLAYLDTAVKPPRNVARSQARHGTGNVNVKKSGPQPSPAAIQSVKERLAKESLAAPAAIIVPSKNILPKKKKAPLMQKTLQLFKGLKR